ncbi:uncharacterized protein LOC100842428 [Brachypodium distachyon]|uniref:Disease resistance protein At4g27190-like leucine-rich repeats domain-containing protein n=2 Tax=Brachypodium distachyon TaxID=15368 RepID=A0A2K2D6D3_BRADI|nr:uncharacterized protein LOC100842428 [Brachypodium distachyon]PNT69842.1 hypothetical protein BRADI_2g01280v3 [Brachypodium distachyon]|eukprot:XP_003565260.3 uncharacterized protein LOC100842428 [Brachypodium distachyon]
MSLLDKWGFYSTDVDTAREEILKYLAQMGNRKVIYFDGWHGFGASAVLTSVAEVLPSRRTIPGLCFDRVIFIDCSKWKNRRALQRAIAEELKLDSSVMASLDKEDEEDDFHGVDESSRNEIDSVALVVDQTLSGTKFILIFLNGSDDEVDVGLSGIPRFSSYGNSMMLWTFKRPCLTVRIPEMQTSFLDKLRYTQSSLIYPYPLIKQLTSSEFQAILHAEAADIVARNPCVLDIDPKTVADCCLYELFLLYNSHIATKSDWVAHASNYWMCDGIIQGDRAMDISKALHQEINWECDSSLLDEILKKFMKYLKPAFMAVKDDDVYTNGPYRWISITSRNMKLHGMETIPAATSSFLAFERSDQPPTLPKGLFEHSSKLSVLILHCCAFKFASPPFHKCHSLRFVGLHRCIDDKTIDGKDPTNWSFLCSLWVLDLRHTDWIEILSEEKLDIMTNMRELNIEGIRSWQYAALLQGRLSNLQRLRIINPTCRSEASKDVDNSFTDKTSMEILDLSGNSEMEILPISLSTAGNLQILVLDGCDGLENVDAPSHVPPSIKSFSFDGYGPASKWTQTVELPPKQFRPSSRTDNKETRISKISLEGCTQLENLFLRGLPNLAELDLSGTAIKILDFKTMVVEVPRLKRLFLIGCKHLRAIIWSDERKPDLELICIDTRPATMCQRPSIDKNKSFGLQVHAVIVDARIARSLCNLLRLYYMINIHITSSPVYDGAVISEAINKDKIDNSNQESLQQLIPAGRYRDVLGMVGVAPMQAFPQPPTRELDQHLEIAEGSCYVESEVDKSLGQLMQYYIESLHVHDVSVRAIISQEYMWWDKLRRCCVERCCKLDTIFPSKSSEFKQLETFWVSDLLMARSIWSKDSSYPRFNDTKSFQYLQHLHLRSCPRLQSVLPVWVSSFPSLETLHIIHCGDLSHIFILDGDYPEEITTNGVPFPKLAAIHLHDLPKLQKICESFNMVAPALESIKIRGCWSLRRLPSVVSRGRGKKKPTVEIEKEVWDALEWDAGHRPDHFEAPGHSRYYKKKMPRGSVLR